LQSVSYLYGRYKKTFPLNKEQNLPFARRRGFVANCPISAFCRVLLADGTPAAEGLPDTAWVAAALQAQGGTTPQ
jgi:hypothetical protein